MFKIRCWKLLSVTTKKLYFNLCKFESYSYFKFIIDVAAILNQNESCDFFPMKPLVGLHQLNIVYFQQDKRLQLVAKKTS